MAVDTKRKMFLHAEMFRVTAETLYFDYGEAAVFKVPREINHAFACELYLKCLLALTTPFVPKIHLLHLLFDQLPKTQKANAVRHYQRLSAGDEAHLKFFTENPHWKRELRALLEGGAEVFEKVRYGYEGIPDMLTSFHWPICALRECIFEIHPDWRPKNPTYIKKKPTSPIR